MLRVACCVLCRFRPLRLEVGNSALRDVQHPLAEVQAGHAGPAPGERCRQVARAAAEIQRSLPGLRAGQLDHAPFPKAMQAKALQIIDQIVARCDAGEEFVHPRRALLAWIEVGIAHGCTSLRQAPPLGDQNRP